tara:strand:+ start:105 stop:215 length:111 start_codon:yes stop_codon:yes gene_type:complete
MGEKNVTLEIAMEKNVTLEITMGKKCNLGNYHGRNL